MAQFDFYDPKFQGLLTLAAGLLQQSGWQPQRVGIGEAIGRAGGPALQSMQQAQRYQMEDAERKKIDAFRELQRRHLELQIGQEEALPQQLSQWQNIVANIDQIPQAGDDSSAPGVRSMSPQPEVPQGMPLPPMDQNQIMQQQLLGPFAQQQQSVPRETYIGAPEDVQLAQTGQTTAPQVDVTGSQAQGLYDYADRLEGELAKFTNLHPKAQSVAQAQIKTIRDRAERLDKAAERRGAAPKTETEISPDGTKQRNVAWNPKSGKFDIPLGGWRPVFSDKPLVNVGVETYDKTGGTKRAESVSDMNKSALRASRLSKTIGYLADALEGYSGGPITEFQGNVGRFFPESEYGKIASVQDLAKSVVGKAFQDVRQEGTGQVSDFESKTFISVFPTLAATPQGRQIIRSFAERSSERELVAADIYQRLADKGPVSLVQWEKMVNDEAGPLFTPQEWEFIKQGAKASGTTLPKPPKGGSKPWERTWQNQ